MNFQVIKVIILLGFIFISKETFSQAIYYDPATSSSMIFYSNQLKNGQNRTISEQTKLQRAQLWVGVKMEQVKTIQDKVYKGLKEVSGTLKNGLQVKNIYRDVQKCRSYASDIINIGRKHPQFIVFTKKTSQLAYEQALRVGSDVSSLLSENELNLATAGDRYRLLNSIEDNVRLLKIRLIGIKLSLEKAIRYGFWGSVNPFQTYINTDKDIVENILERWERF